MTYQPPQQEQGILLPGFIAQVTEYRLPGPDYQRQSSEQEGEELRLETEVVIDDSSTLLRCGTDVFDRDNAITITDRTDDISDRPDRIEITYD